VTESEGAVKVLVLGATSAIASATIRIYASRGAALYLVARDPKRLSVIASDAQIRGASAVYTRQANLNDTAAHASLVADAIQQLSYIDIALVAYGVLGDQGDGERDIGTALAVFQTNFISSISLITHLANELERRKSGTIAVISSVAGDRGRKSNYIYGASKAAVTVFLQGLRNRLDRRGVHVLTVKPGLVSTPMTAHLEQGVLFASPEKIALGIVSAIDHRKDVVYLPWFWRPILSIIRSIPERIFKRLDL